MLISPNDRIFIAGHRGMVGSAICRALSRGGYSSVLIANRESLDLLNPDAVAKWFESNQPSVVILAAAKVGGIQANDSYPADFLIENLKIQNHVIESAWRNGTRRLLFLGSSCIYPRDCPQPIREEFLLTGPLESTNEWYAVAKITGIQLCRALKKQYGFDAISLMPTNLYGPGDNYHSTNSHVLPALIRRFHEAKINRLQSVCCWGSGNPRREFLHVDDLGNAVVHALQYWQPGTTDLQHLNVGTGIDISIKELAHLAAEVVDFNGQIEWDRSKPDGTPQKLLDVSRINNIGWQAKISIDQGLSSTYLNFKKEITSETIRY